MITQNYQYDYTELDQLLSTEFDPDLLAELLFKSMEAITHHGVVSLNQNTTQIMQRLTATRKLAQAIKTAKK